ncbi:MAG: 16S rRNA (adenine(1518)-N(6)/adenine(1519)-N(6))-dimethyltransferase RsmA [Bacteroidota bacterium]
MKAKKSFGQHFLNREDIAARIAGSLQLNEATHKILEVGPGRGMLTKYLLQQDQELLVVEADRDMVLHLKKHYPTLKENIISADFLKVNLKLFFEDSPFALIGNFPYNISSQILFKMLEYRDQIPEMVGMFQKEVAERVVAPPGDKTYGVTSVLIQAFYEGHYLFSVEKSSFTPPPKVKSGVIRLVRRETPLINCSEKIFRRVVKVAFQQRRKMLRNTIKSLIPNDPILKESIFEKRPEKLSIEEFAALAAMIEQKLS